METEYLLEAYWTAPRQELRAWFRRNAPSLGELYEGALRMLFTGEFPGRTRFVAHAVREIYNQLPKVIVGPKKSVAVQYKNEFDQITKYWREAGFPLDGGSNVKVTAAQDALSIDVPIPRMLWNKMALLVKNHVEAREKPIEAATRLFEGIAPENKALRVTLRPIINQWDEVTKLFVKTVHDSGDRDSDTDGNEFLRNFEIFEMTLCALVRGFFKTVEGLDEILEDANS